MNKLPAAYLNNVIEKMLAYGESVQFSGAGNVDGPNYQVINGSGKKISFDSNNLLIHTEEKDFSAKNAAVVYSLEQVRAQLVKLSSPPVKATPAKSRKVAGSPTPRGGSAAAVSPKVRINRVIAWVSSPMYGSTLSRALINSRMTVWFKSARALVSWATSPSCPLFMRTDMRSRSDLEVPNMREVSPVNPAALSLAV